MTRRADPSFKIMKNPGSPNSDEPGFVIVGKLRRPHGVRGEIVMEVLTDYPKRIRVGKQVYIGEEHKPLVISSRREKPPGILISFEGYNDCDKVADFTNQYIYSAMSELPPLEANEYYYHQLIGLNVENKQGERLGKLEEILETGANDVFLVRTPDSNEILLPVIDSVIVSIDLSLGRIIVNPPEWG